MLVYQRVILDILYHWMVSRGPWTVCVDVAPIARISPKYGYQPALQVPGNVNIPPHPWYVCQCLRAILGLQVS